MRRCEALVVRYTADPLVGEALNVGVVLLVPDAGYCRARFISRWQRVTSAFPSADLKHLRRVTAAITEALGKVYSPRQLDLQPSARLQPVFDRIVPPEHSSLLQSMPIAGVTRDPDRTLDELFARYIYRSESTGARAARSATAVWSDFERLLKKHGIDPATQLPPRVVDGRRRQETFRAGWMNGCLNVATPVSLDLKDDSRIWNRASSWTGRLLDLEPMRKGVKVHLLVAVPGPDAPPAIQQASADGLGLLRDQVVREGLAEVVTEPEAEQLARRIRQDLAHAEADG